MSGFICNRVLLTNDDGLDAPGLSALENVARRLAKEVWVVAPEKDQSGTSQSVSLHHPVRFRQDGEKRFAVEGTPADCVIMATRLFMAEAPPDFILSGINRGANIGNETVFSGTVGAAMTGILLGFRAIALSQCITDRQNVRWDTAEYAAEVVLRELMLSQWNARHCFNVNLPDTEPDQVKSIVHTRQGQGNLQDIAITVRADPRAVPYAWLSLERNEPHEAFDCEGAAVRAGHITVTPLHYDRTDYAALTHEVRT